MILAQQDRWTKEAIAMLKDHPEANPALPSTETEAWRSGYVAGYCRAKEIEYEEQRQRAMKV